MSPSIPHSMRIFVLGLVILIPLVASQGSDNITRTDADTDQESSTVSDQNGTNDPLLKAPKQTTLYSIPTIAPVPKILDFLEDPTWNLGGPKITFGKDTLEMKLRTRIAEVTIPIALIAIFGSFVGFFICLVCPTCILKRLRARKLRRGYKRKPLVIRVAPNPPPLQQPATAETSLSSSSSGRRISVVGGPGQNEKAIVHLEQRTAITTAGNETVFEEVYERKDTDDESESQFDEVELNDLSSNGQQQVAGNTRTMLGPNCVIILNVNPDEVEEKDMNNCNCNPAYYDAEETTTLLD